MRELHLAKSAGFCYGVRRAVELAESAAASGTPCVLLGHAPTGRAGRSMRPSRPGAPTFWTPPVPT